MIKCPNCFHENPLHAKFCMECGTKLTAGESAKKQQSVPSPIRREAERRQLTVMFCDLVGSTALSDRLDPEDYRQVIIDYQQIAGKVIIRYSGHIAQYLGDGLLVYFGYPQGLEDAPKASIIAGLGILEAVAQANQQWEIEGKTTIKVRIGIHTGIVVVDDLLALGDTTNIAARLEGLAPVNGLVISPQTLKLVEGWFEVKSIGTHHLKGIALPMEVFQVLRESGVRTRLDIARGKGLSPLVGRDKEYQLLRERWQKAKAGNGNLVLLNGEAGIGKSRLVDTLKEEILHEPGSWLTEIRCSAHHQNSTFYPIIDLLENTVLQFEREESSESKLNKLEAFLLQLDLELSTGMPLFADFLAIPSEQYPPPVLSPLAKKQRLMENITQVVLHQAAVQPVLLVLEDLHWADASTLEWLQLFLGQLFTQPIFVLCSTRPGFQPQWMNQAEVTQITLQRLPIEKVAAICWHYTKGKALPQEIIEQINTKTQGVPLFVEELIKMVLESGWVIETENEFLLDGPLPNLAIPSTLQDSLLARLDRLSMVKEVVQLSSVLGGKFSFELLQAVLEKEETKLPGALSQLVEAEILYRIGIGKSSGYQFKHALIQDAAYESMLKSRRQQLHRKVAHVMETQFAETIVGQPEQIARHYTLGELPIQAIPLWLKAGQLASQKHANSEAIVHLKAGLKLLSRIENEEEQRNVELDFLLALGNATIRHLGLGHPRVEEIFGRAKKIAQKVEVNHKVAFILYNLMIFYLQAEKYTIGKELALYLLKLGHDSEDGYWFKLLANHILGVYGYFTGDFDLACKNLKSTVDFYDPSRTISEGLTQAGNTKINASGYLALSLLISGFPDQALRISKNQLSLAKEYGNPSDLFHIYAITGWYFLEARNWEQSVKVLSEYLPRAREFGDMFFILISECHYYFAKAFLGERAALKKATELFQVGVNAGSTNLYGCYSAYIGELYYRFGEHESCLQMIDKTLHHVDRTGSHMRTPELYRIKGLALQALGKPEALIEKNLNQALEQARMQSAKTFELRAAADLARLLRKHGKIKEAQELLQGVYSRFTEGFDSVDLQEARALLMELEN